MEFKSAIFHPLAVMFKNSLKLKVGKEIVHFKWEVSMYCYIRYFDFSFLPQGSFWKALILSMELPLPVLMCLTDWIFDVNMIPEYHFGGLRCFDLLWFGKLFSVRKDPTVTWFFKSDVSNAGASVYSQFKDFADKTLSVFSFLHLIRLMVALTFHNLTKTIYVC